MLELNEEFIEFKFPELSDEEFDLNILTMWEQTVYKILCIAVITLFAWAFYEIGQDNLAAMETCQQTRSYDTCAYDLLR